MRFGRTCDPDRLLAALPTMTGGEAKVALAIFARWQNKAEKCWPGFKQLALDTKLSRSTISRAVKRLEGRLWSVQRKAGRGHAAIIKSIRKGSTGDTFSRPKRYQGTTVKGSTGDTPKDTKEKTVSAGGIKAAPPDEPDGPTKPPPGIRPSRPAAAEISP